MKLEEKKNLSLFFFSIIKLIISDQFTL